MTPHRLKQTFFYLLVFACSVMTGQSQVRISGNLVSQSDQSPAVGVVLIVEQTGASTISDGQGRFELETDKLRTLTLITQSLEFLPTATLLDPAVASHDLTIELEEWVMDLPAIVVASSSVTGGRGGISGIPGTAHYISPKQVGKFQYGDVHRLLASIPGVQIQEEDGFGLRPNIGLRGSGVERSSKITLMEDGILMAPAPYSAPAAYYFPTIARMRSVEVLKGSSQVKYGPQTNGGVINLISAQIPHKFSGLVRARAGSYGTQMFEGQLGADSKFVGFSVQGIQQNSTGFKSLPSDEETGFSKRDVIGKLRFHTADGARWPQSLTLKAGMMNEISNETYLGLAEPDFDDHPFQRYAGSQMDEMKAEHTQISAQYVFQFAQDWHLSLTAYRNDFSRNWYKLDAVSDSDGDKNGIGTILADTDAFSETYKILKGETSDGSSALWVKANNRDYISEGVQGHVAWSSVAGSWRHNAQIGFRLHQDEMDRFQWLDGYGMLEGGRMSLLHAGLPGTESNRIESTSAVSGYIQYELSYNRLSVSPGLRYENIKHRREDFGKNDPDRIGNDLTMRENAYDVLVPGLGIEYAFARSVNLFAGIHKGFGPSGSKEGTDPESSINYEIGTRIASKGFSGSLAFYLNDYENLLGADLNAAGGSGSTDLFNGGEALNKGLEIELGYTFHTSWLDANWPLSLTYTLAEATFSSSFDSEFGGWGEVENGDHLPYFARNRASLALGMENEHFQCNVSCLYVDEMLSTPGGFDESGITTIPSNFLSDISFHWIVDSHLTLSASVNNIFDKTYLVSDRPAGLRPGMPRTFIFGLEGRF